MPTIHEDTTSLVLSAEGLVRHFRLARDRSGDRPLLRAVDYVSVTLRKMQTLGIVGESGCGKSTLGRLVVGLLPPTSGTVRFRGAEIKPSARRKEARGKLQMVFQDPQSSLDPRMTVRRSVGTPLFGNTRGADRERVGDYLARVGIAASLADRYPHELSGGQQQRAAIARALISDPAVVVLDEAVSALDVSLRAQILNLLLDLQQDLGVSYVFISHDLRAVEAVSDEIAVMYLGQVIERAPTESLVSRAMHPYSMALRSASLAPHSDVRRVTPRILLRGDMPSAVSPPAGCRFSTRCPIVQEVCMTTPPPFVEHRPNHWAACHFAAEAATLMASKTKERVGMRP